MRVMKDGKDSRFDKVRDKPARFLVYWMLQGVWVLVTLAPTLMLNNSTRDPPLGARDYLGWSMWLVGMCFECLADFQKSMFKANPANKVAAY